MDNRLSLLAGGMTTLPDSLRLARFVAAGFGSGWLPKAPGTWGSLAALPIGLAQLYLVGLLGLVAGLILVTIVGFYACARVLPTLADADPGWIVIDEWAGQWLCLLIAAPFLLHHPILLAVAAFVLFRLFDIVKPWPIRPLEHIGPSWWSIMVDDLAAGLLGGTLLAALAWAAMAGGGL